MSEQPTATAYMRFSKIKFDRVVPAHIWKAINASYADGTISNGGLMKMHVLFHESGEAYGVNFRANNYTLGHWNNSTGFHQGAFMKLPPEAVAYLSYAAEEALAIVQPIVTVH